LLDFSILTENLDIYLDGYKYTIIASLIALVGSFVLGTVIAVFRIAPFKPLNWLGTVYVEFIRNIPLLVVVFFFFFGLRFSGTVAGTIGLTIYTAAFIAEAYGQTMQMIILPQAIKIVIPPLGNQFINLVKNSSILGIVAGLDLMYQADLISSRTYVTFDVYIFVAVFYLTLTIPLSIGVGFMEKRLAKSN
jgi:putative glutamine transport system permease protein